MYWCIGLVVYGSLRVLVCGLVLFLMYWCIGLWISGVWMCWCIGVWSSGVWMYSCMGVLVYSPDAV